MMFSSSTETECYMLRYHLLKYTQINLKPNAIAGSLSKN